MILLHRCQFCGGLCTRDIDGIHLCDSTDCEAVLCDSADCESEVMGCKGFQWLGQSWEHCDGCGEPYWEHTFDQRFNHNKGPFDDDIWFYVRISDESKAHVRAQYVKE